MLLHLRGDYLHVMRVVVLELLGSPSPPQPRPHRRFRGIECKGVKIYDVQKVTFSTLFKLYIAELGVLISKRYHMLG